MNKDNLNKILDDHKLWLNTNGSQGVRANLSNADLRNANLSYADLRNADLRNADLSNADLRNADLSNADLRNANLRNANLGNADLSYANLSNADLSNAHLRNADLSNANLRNADLRNADLDFSVLPLWCGGLDIHIDDKQAIQLLYHLVRNVNFSKNTSEKMKRLCRMKTIVTKANEFHRSEECGLIEVEK